ncbi:MAG: hypothetical protein AAF773_03890 [Cyanobacteria bacterium P01_D01_bin.115]
MQAAEDLKEVMGGGDQPLRAYLPQSAPRVLQQILDQISLKNTFSNTTAASTDSVESSTFSPDGEALVITDREGNATLKTPQGIEIRTLDGHSQEIWHADFSPDGQIIGTASEIFRLFDRDGTLIKTLEHPFGDVGRIRFSPDGQYIAITGWGEDVISLLDIDGNLVTNINAQTVGDIDFHPNKPILANASRNGTVEIWDFQGNKVSTLEGHEQAVVGVRFSPAGDYLVSGSPDESIRLWNLEAQTSEIIDDVDGSTYGIDFHPNGEHFAAGSTGGIAKIWALDGNVVQDLPGHVGAIEDVSFSPDGNRLATAGSDGQVRMWALNSKTVADLSGHTDALWYPDVSPDGTQIATASKDGTVRIWDLSGTEIRRLELPDSFSKVVYSPDGTTLATATFPGDIQLWNVEGNLITRFPMHNTVVQGLDISPDGQYGVSGSEDFTAKLWDFEGNVITTVTHDEWVRDAVFSPDGQTFATVSEDDLARLWDLDGNLLAEFAGHADGVNAISFSPDGTKLVTASDDSTVKLWDLQGNLIHSFQNHHGRVWTVAFSPSDDAIATGTSDGYARLWDLDGNLIGEFKGHEAIVTSVNFSPDGQYLVTTSGALFAGSGDNTARVWRIASTLDDLLAQGCDWLADYLTLHPEALLELESCQRPDILPQAAPYLVQKARQTAQAGDLQLVEQQLTTALTWNPDVDLDPETLELDQNVTQVARTLSATYHLTEAQRLANQLKLEEATQAYEQALALNPAADLDPATESVEQDAALIARRHAALGLQKQGRLQAQQLKLEAATQTLEEALELYPTLDLNPDTGEIEQDIEAMVRQFSAPSQLNAGGQLVKNGDVEAAVQAYQTALDSDPDLEVLQSTWDTLCWFGSLQGQAAKVRFACENEASFSGPSTFDSRGIVLALDGDIEGAIESFQAYIDVPGRSQDRVIQGQAWIDALQSGENPFTPEVLESLP